MNPHEASFDPWRGAKIILNTRIPTKQEIDALIAELDEIVIESELRTMTECDGFVDAANVLNKFMK